jgi:O-Antigen ligase
MRSRTGTYDTLQISKYKRHEPVALSRLPEILVVALIPLTVVNTAILHSLLSSIALASILLIVTIILFCTGQYRLHTPHKWIGIIGASALLAYLIPQVRLEPSGQPRQALIWLLLGLLVLTVSVASPPNAGILIKVILLTGTLTAIAARVQGSLLSGRLQGIGLNPNYLAVYLATSSVISAGFALSRRNPLWLIPGSICMSSLLASQSREGLLAAIAGIVFTVTQKASPNQKVLLTLVTVSAFLLFPGDLNLITSIGAGTRSAAELNTDNVVRSQVALFALHVAADHPIRGIGLGQFPAYAQASGSLGFYVTTTNEYLLLAAETGLSSLVAMVALLWTGIRRARRGDIAIVRASVFTSIIAMLFIDLFPNPVVSMPFWACLGILLARERES